MRIGLLCSLAARPPPRLASRQRVPSPTRRARRRLEPVYLHAPTRLLAIRHALLHHVCLRTFLDGGNDLGRALCWRLRALFTEVELELELNWN